MTKISESAVLFRQPCRFMAGAGSIASLPEFTHPEVAFIGRSNVGKSSLVNALVGQNKLAKTSQNPGHTKQLNFFLLAERLMMVDMPGYGYAKVSKVRKSEWDNMISSYLCGRPTLQRACLLIDGRRGIMPHDDEFMSMLDDSAVNYQIILTKMDTLTKAEESEVLQTVANVLKMHVAAHPRIIATSSKDKRGIEELQDELAAFVLK
ncbi:MAG: ribosome biogenesis GTP-binding protein YihA/YsxC [Rickettsiales bacterium]|jgi:GTP-binding protein